MSQSALPGLPVEILGIIAEFSTTASLVPLCQTNRRIHAACFRHIYHIVHLESLPAIVKCFQTPTSNAAYAGESLLPKWTLRRSGDLFQSAMSQLKNVEIFFAQMPSNFFFFMFLPCTFPSPPRMRNPKRCQYRITGAGSPITLTLTPLDENRFSSRLLLSFDSGSDWFLVFGRHYHPLLETFSRGPRSANWERRAASMSALGLGVSSFIAKRAAKSRTMRNCHRERKKTSAYVEFGPWGDKRWNTNEVAFAARIKARSGREKHGQYIVGTFRTVIDFEKSKGQHFVMLPDKVWVMQSPVTDDLSDDLIRRGTGTARMFCDLIRGSRRNHEGRGQYLYTNGKKNVGQAVDPDLEPAEITHIGRTLDLGFAEFPWTNWKTTATPGSNRIKKKLQEYNTEAVRSIDLIAKRVVTSLGRWGHPDPAENMS
ncbi:hypothetical protein DFH09DRAFT_1094356 [Mycena vulgaris]|nr:hypothetical protein DFH09DRAFT_1094356 [Mycena vulgaris]